MAPNIWKELGLEPTQEKSAIKKAYAQKLKTLDLATDQEAFQRLRRAFEWALVQCDRAAAVQEVPVVPEEPSESPKPRRTSTRKPVEPAEEPTPEKSAVPDPREVLLRVADRITEALLVGQDREAAYDLEQTSSMEDFQHLEARWFLAETLLQRLYQFRGRMPVAFCLRFVKHFGLKAESRKDFPQMRDMVELLLHIAELQQMLDGVRKRKIPWPWLNPLQRIQLPYRPYLTWFYGLTNKPRPLSASMEEIVEHLERINTDPSAFGIDPRTLSWWKGRLERWFHPFQLKSMAQSYWFWILSVDGLYLFSAQKWSNRLPISDGFLILVFLFMTFAVPLSFFYEISVLWDLKTRKSKPRYSKIFSTVFISIMVLVVLAAAMTDTKTVGGAWPIAAIVLFRLVMSWNKRK